jgi:uncharacterized protein (TIGR00661 family)
MRILYGIQGTGNGHISRAKEIIPYLKEYSDVDVLISGTQSDVAMNQSVKYRFNGLGYAFGSHGKIDLSRTLMEAKIGRLIHDVRHLPISDYDMIISDFEPISAWAGKLAGKHVVAMSHQASFLSDLSPRPAKRNAFAEGIFKHYAPCNAAIGFHFKRYDNFIHKPIIRKAIRELTPTRNDHITVYMPAFHHETLVSIFHKLPEIRWDLFSKHAQVNSESRNVTIRPIDDTNFVRSLESCQGLLTGAGFEAPSEALFLGKMLMVVPMSMQYEQQCNAKALRLIGVPVLPIMNDYAVEPLRRWLNEQHYIQVRYEDRTRNIVHNLLKMEIAA